MNSNKACLHLSSDTRGTKNYPFISGPEGEGFKNLLFPYIYLRESLAELGIDLATKDINHPEDSFLLFCLDDPHTLVTEKGAGQIWCLIINDPPVYAPQSWDRSYHDRFDFVFTYDETLVDNEKYHYFPIAQDTEFFSIADTVTEQEFKERRLATFVSNAIDKFPDPHNPGTTLHRRYNTIKWYGRNHPEDFRFYGGTFEKRDYYFSFRGVSLAKRILPAKLFRSVAAAVQKDLIKVYGGTLTPLQKFEIIRGFNFYYCYENTVGINGYLSEKIFDCLYSGVVPIYWGAPNVKELVPYDCYIDGSRFTDEEGLYNFLKSMSYSKYRSYLEQARAFLESDSMERFTVKGSVGRLLAPLANRIAAREVAGL